MKRWRRTSSGGGAAAATTPVVVSAVVRGDLSATDVTFNVPVTWNGVDAGTFQIGDPGGEWISQVSPATIAFDVAPGVSTAWLWTGPDASLTPVPDSSQTGMTT